MNQGVHGIDMILWLARDVESVFARTAEMEHLELLKESLQFIQHKRQGLRSMEKMAVSFSAIQGLSNGERKRMKKTYTPESKI